MTSKEKVLARYPKAQCLWTSRGWRVLALFVGKPIEIGRTSSGHVPEEEAWDDAASRLEAAHGE